MFATLSDILTSLPGLLLWVVALPLLIGGALAFAPLRAGARRLAPWSALPALVVSTLAPPGTAQSFDWLLLGTRLELDEVGRIFLFFTSLVWLVTGLFASRSGATRPRPDRFWAYFLLTLFGNLGIALARDLPSFLFFFSAMGLCSYGLVVHSRTEGAVRAGRIYLALIVVSEALLYAGSVLAVLDAPSLLAGDVARAVAGSPHRLLIVALMVGGFGLKAGFVPLHVSLPPAYVAASASGAALLSAAMSKAGVLGCMLFLPVGLASVEPVGLLFLLGGLLGAYYGVVVGLFQRDPQAMLAYSSISQIGFMAMLLGVGLVQPDLWPAASIATALYAMHHGLSKGALFLGVRICDEDLRGRWPRALAMAGLLLPSLALAGAPLTSGAVAKHGLKDALGAAALPLGGAFDALVTFGAVGTAVLLGRFLFAVWPPQPDNDSSSSGALDLGLWIPWTVIVASILVVPWLFPWAPMQELAHETLSWSSAVGEIWPAALATALVLAVARWGGRVPWLIGLRIPPGDILEPALSALRALGRAADRAARGVAAAFRSSVRLSRDFVEHRGRLPERLRRFEDVLLTWHTGATLLVVLAAIAFALAWSS